MLAQRLGAWVPLDEVPEVWAGVVAIFRDYGYRRLRHRARLKFLVADWGVGEVPRGAGDGVPRRRAARRPGARAPPRGPPRPRRRAPRSRTAASTSASRPASGRVSGDDARAASPTSPRPHGSRPGAAHRRAEAAWSSTSPDERVDALVAELRRPRPAGRAVARSGAADDGLHRHRVLQARDRRDQGARGRPRSTSWRQRLARLHDAADRSTSTAARTPAPASRSPTSASRASSSSTPTGEQVEGFQVHLGGGLRRSTAGFGRKLRGLQGHRRRSCPTTSSASPRALRAAARRRRDVRRSGSQPRRTRTRPASERRAAPIRHCATADLLLPVLRGRGPATRRARHGAWECRGCARAFQRRRFRNRSPREVSHDDSWCQTDLQRSLRSSEAPPSRAARGASAEEILALGGGDVRRPALSWRRSMADAVLVAPRRRGCSPASTCCSSTPATTSPRPSAPATPWPRSTTSNVQHDDAAAHGRRAGRASSAPGCTPATPTCAAPCARSSRWSGPSARTTPGSPACAATRPPPAPTPRVVELGRQARQGQGQPDRARGPRRTSTTTSPTTASWSNPLLYDGYPSIGCGPCTRAGRRPARTRARPLGRPRARPSAACTPERGAMMAPA